MKKYIIAMLLATSCGCFCALLHAQDLSVSVTSPDDGTIVPEAGIQLTADATPANGADGECVTFDWTDPDGDWGTGSVTGLESVLTYYPEGDIYGTAPVINCTVTDGVGDTDFDTVNLVVPYLYTASGTSDLSYYGPGVTYSDGNADGGGANTFLKIRVMPDSSYASYNQWEVINDIGSAQVTASSDASSGIVTSTGGSQQPYDTDIALEDGNGNPAAEYFVCVHFPQSYTVSAVNYQESYRTLLLLTYKGWETDWVMFPTDQFSSPMPGGVPVNEDFNLPVPVLPDDWVVALTESQRVNQTTDLSDGTFTDGYAIAPEAYWVPPPVWRGDQFDSYLVTFREQFYYAGSLTSGDGTQIGDHNVDWHQGYAAQDQ